MAGLRDERMWRMAAERRLPPRSGGLLGSDGLYRLDLANLARLSIFTGQEFGQRLRCAIAGVRRRMHLGEPQWLREPTRILEQALGLLGHFALLEVVDELHGALALRLANRFEDPRLGDAAEVVVDRRPPANLRHVEIDRPRQPIRLIEATLQAMGGHAGSAMAIDLLEQHIDAKGSAVGEQRQPAGVVERGKPVP